MESLERTKCKCVGQRTCGICEGHKSTNKASSNPVSATTTSTTGTGSVAGHTVFSVISQDKDAKISSCPFPSVIEESDPSSSSSLRRLVLCQGCRKLFSYHSTRFTATEGGEGQATSEKNTLLPQNRDLKQEEEVSTVSTLPTLARCSDHHNQSSEGVSHVWREEPSQAIPQGLDIVPNFITKEEETAILRALDQEPCLNGRGWKDSQSGRRKQDFGPQPNFKKRKVKLGPIDDPWQGIHDEYAILQQKISRLSCIQPSSSSLSSSLLCSATKAEASEEKHPQSNTPFSIAQWSALDYQPNYGANLDPHVDDAWIWGERILGISMNSDCIMSFLTATAPEEEVIEIQAVLPRRSIFVMQGPSRRTWVHGIRAGAISDRRVSITIREFDLAFAAQFPDLSAEAVRRVNLLKRDAINDNKSERSVVEERKPNKESIEGDTATPVVRQRREREDETSATVNEP